MAGRAVRSHVFDRAITAASGYIVSELRLTDIKAKLVFLKRKRADHFHLLGKTVYRLVQNDIDPLGNDHISSITVVLDGINREIQMVSDELARRREIRKKRPEQPGESRSQRGTGEGENK